MTPTSLKLGLFTTALLALGAQPPAEPPAPGAPVPRPSTPVPAPRGPVNLPPPAGAQPAIPSFGGGSAVFPQNIQQGQNYGPGPRPIISPYLNLGRINNNFPGAAAVNYFNFVRPYTVGPGPYATNPNTALPTAPYGTAAGIPSDIALEPDTVLRPTGHPTTFLNYGGYFNSAGSIGQGAQQQRPNTQGAGPRRR